MGLGTSAAAPEDAPSGTADPFENQSRLSCLVLLSCPVKRSISSGISAFVGEHLNNQGVVCGYLGQGGYNSVTRSILSVIARTGLPFEVQLCGVFPSSQAIIIVIYIHIASSSPRYCIKYYTNSAMAPLILV